ncbi:MAG: glycerophosphodiester phosphodiesterase [Muribaculaceae bacterium]|nr:glycerophosphodiester phosphodiesterase [Muribaculaceae bacterium]
MKRFILILAFALTAGLATWAQEVICHRGYWDTEGSAQNSIRSLVKADSIKAWGSEFDVWMTADGMLVVNHDETFNGVTIETAKWKQLKDMRLRNGEKLPTLEAMLKCGKTLSTRLIVEMKPHTDRAQELEAARKIVKMVKKLGLESRVEYITFSYQGMKNLKEMAPAGTPVYYLNGELSPTQLAELDVAGIDYSIEVMRAHPQWIDETHSLGMKVNVWTVNSDRDMMWCIGYGVDFITTNAPERLQHLLDK